jgi:hypothetical protein
MAPFSVQLWQMFMQFVMLSFVVFGALGLAVGVGLIASSQKTLRVFQVVNRWISTRSVLKQVEVPHDTDRIAHKYRHWIGVAFIVFGAIATFGLIARIDVSALSEMFAKGEMRPLAALIVQCVRWFLIVGSVGGLAVGAMLLLSPTAEDTLERFTNKWVSTRRIARGGDEMHLTLDRLVEAHPAPSGWIVACAAAAVMIYGLVMLGRY